MGHEIPSAYTIMNRSNRNILQKKNTSDSQKERGGEIQDRHC